MPMIFASVELSDWVEGKLNNLYFGNLTFDRNPHLFDRVMKSTGSIACSLFVTEIYKGD